MKNDSSKYQQLLGLATLAIFGMTPTLALAQGGDAEVSSEQGEKQRLEAEAAQVEATKDSLVGPDTFTNPKVQADEDEEAPGNSYEFGKDGRINFQLSLSSRFSTRDNMDFRARDDSSPQAVIDSDDNIGFGATQMLAGLDLRLNKSAAFGISIAHNGLWGGGAFGDAVDDNTLFINTLFFDWNVLDAGGVEIKGRFGRQFFSVGGARKDYFFRDVVDGATIDADFGAGGKLRILAVDLVAAQIRPDEVDFFRRSTTTSSNLNFGGDTNTMRYGAVYENTTALKGLEARAFGFFANVGAGNSATSTGADLSYGGQLGNFADGDYNWLGGTRIGYFFEDEAQTMRVGGYGEFARSGGLDRKATVYGLRDVTSDGNAFGVGLEGDFKLGDVVLNTRGNYFRADGPQYASDGIVYNYGFVSMKGNHVGSLAMDDTAGWHPSAYAATFAGVDFSPQEQQRKSGMQVIHVGLGVGLVDTLQLDLEFWNMTDTGFTFLDAADVPTAAQDLPFGYSQSDLEAQQRLGKSLGNELSAGLTYMTRDLVSVYAQGSVFLPGDFFAQEITRSGGTALGSDDPQNFWVVLGGVTVDWK